MCYFSYNVSLLQRLFLLNEKIHSLEYLFTKVSVQGIFKSCWPGRWFQWQAIIISQIVRKEAQKDKGVTQAMFKCPHFESYIYTNFNKSHRVFAICSQPRSVLNTILLLITWVTTCKLPNLPNLSNFIVPMHIILHYAWIRNNICKTQQVLLIASITLIFRLVNNLNDIKSKPFKMNKHVE